MKNKNSKFITIEKTSSLENIKPLSKAQLKTILGGTDPTTSRGTKTSASN